MLVVEGVLREELQRLQDMKKVYEEQQASLPKGSLQQRTIHGRLYVYRKFRDASGKVVQKYVGSAESEPATSMQQQIELRKKHEAALREILAEIRLIGKVIKQSSRPQKRPRQRKERCPKIEIVNTPLVTYSK